MECAGVQHLMTLNKRDYEVFPFLELVGPDVEPPYMEEALRRNPTAWDNFQRLAPSHRKNYVRWIDEAKKEETRQQRLQKAIRMLEANEKIGLK